MKKYLLIYNRKSGSDHITELIADLLPLYQAEGILLVPFCLNMGSKRDFLPLLEKGEFSGVLISGGDGSIRSVISFLIRNGIFLPIGILPAGTCNDLANSMGLPRNLMDAARIPLKGKTLKLDVGLVNGTHYFFSSCAGGYFMPATYETPAHAKKNIKQFAYYFKAATQPAAFRPYDFQITMDGILHKMRGIMFGFATGSQIAGFSNILNEASLTDGKLDLFVIGDCSYLELPGILFNILRGNFTEQKHVRYFQGTSFRIDGPLNLPVVLDGDEGPALPLEVEIAPLHIEVFI